MYQAINNISSSRVLCNKEGLWHPAPGLLNPSLFLAILLISPYDSYLNSSSIPNLFLFLCLLPCIRPSTTFPSYPFSRSTCPIQCFFFIFRTFTSFILSSSLSSISAFVFVSVHIIFSIVLQIRNSKVSNILKSSFLNVVISDPYSTTLRLYKKVFSYTRSFIDHL